MDSREIEESAAVRRRRECDRCSKRFTTYERIDEIPYMVVKKDGRREKFDRQKMLTGLQHACEKRPIAMRQLEALVDAAEVYLNDRADRERTTSELGAVIMGGLKQLDTVAYIRFAERIREFKDAAEFRDELERLVEAATAGACRTRSRKRSSAPRRKPPPPSPYEPTHDHPYPRRRHRP